MGSISFAPLRVKCSADFGTVNTDINTAAAAGTTYKGIERAFPAPGRGLLINVNVAEDLIEDLVLELGPSQINAGYTWRPIRVAAAGAVGWVHTPLGMGHPTGQLFFRVSVKAKAAIGSLIVTTQYFDY